MFHAERFMTVEEARAGMAEVEELSRYDFQRAHEVEDQLIRRYLRWVAVSKKPPGSLRAVANILLRLKRVKFPRVPVGEE